VLRAVLAVISLRWLSQWAFTLCGGLIVSLMESVHHGTFQGRSKRDRHKTNLPKF